jgi:hypothetical protein
MSRRFLGACCALLLGAGSLLALEAVGTLKKIDVERGVVIVFAGGQDRTLKTDKDTRFLDTAGKALTDGLKSKELKENAEVTITVERENSELILKAIRLGRKDDRDSSKNAGNTKDVPALLGKASVGLKPLNEMTAQDRYKGEDGGLYGNGQNEPPAEHLAAAKAATSQIAPLGADGKPARDGKIGLVSISMSNATQEFSFFKRIADADAQKSPLLTVVDCAQGGQAMAQWVPPDAKAWAEMERRLKAAGVSAQQVQVAWIKLANMGPRGELTEHGKKLYADTLAVIQNAKSKYPNLRVVYVGSRIYAGNATGALNPEPFAYESAFVVRWLIRDQMKHEAALNFDPARGAVKSPVLLWGPYLWADGTTPRKTDGLVYERNDFAADGVHPSESGRAKVARQLLTFFKTDAVAKTWFVSR